MGSFNNFINSVNEELIKSIANSAEMSFPEHAEKALDRVESDLLDFESIFADIMKMESLPNQYYSAEGFGEYNITLLRTDSYEMHLYVMNKCDTNIHDHPFVGAFKILKGQSIHISYDFIKSNEIEQGLVIGDLISKEGKILKENDIQKVNDDSIHYLSRIADRNISFLIMSRNKSSNSFFLPPGIKIENKAISNETFYRKFNFYKKSFNQLTEIEAQKYFLDLVSSFSMRERIYFLLGELSTNTGFIDDKKSFGNFLLSQLKENLKMLGLEERYLDIESHMIKIKQKARALAKLINS